ncbi:MAG: hypothetical protein IKQ37_02330 [Bacteroidaceae bacterium]|nr:hypothetical protein [Bacteroidaceae bacterium]
MKRHLFISVVMLFGIGLYSAYAQNQWVIRFNDGSERAFNINEIKEMFPREGTPINPTEPDKIVFTVHDDTPQTRSIGAGMQGKLNNHFVVEGVKYVDSKQTVVFDDYFVKYVDGSEPSVWDYVGLTNINDWNQPIKYWDNSSEKYNFIAYSTGDAMAVYNEAAGLSDGQVFVSPIDVSKMNGVVDDKGKITDGAFTMKGKTADLAKAYVADAKTVYKGNDYGKEVELSFHPLSTQLRLAFYETIPGYSVRDLKFYENDETVADGEARLYTDNIEIFSDYGQYIVYYPTMGTINQGSADYNKPHIAFVADTNGPAETNKLFGALNYSTKEFYEPNGDYLGRASYSASFAGKPSDNYFAIVNPNEAGATLNIKVDYTLVSTDGSGEIINIKGATAQVPAKYTSWQSGYSYTYLFKIYDLSWGGTSMNPEEMFPITFEAVVIDKEQSSVVIVNSEL